MMNDFYWVVGLLFSSTIGGIGMVAVLASLWFIIVKASLMYWRLIAGEVHALGEVIEWQRAGKPTMKNEKLKND